MGAVVLSVVLNQRDLSELRGCCRGAERRSREGGVGRHGSRGQGRWLKPLFYAAGTVAVVFDGVLLLIRHWQLTVLQLVAAAWVWVMSWNLRNHMLANASTVGFAGGP
jgi:hypothetical protein